MHAEHTFSIVNAAASRPGVPYPQKKDGTVAASMRLGVGTPLAAKLQLNRGLDGIK
jgi:hypothetical protein